MRTRPGTSSNTGKTTPALTWFLVVVLAGAVVWVWWKGSQSLSTDRAGIVTNALESPEHRSSPRPTTVSLPTRPGKPDAASRAPVDTAAPPTVVTSAPTRSMAGETSPPPVAVIVPTNAPAVSSGPEDADARFRCILEAQLALARLAISPGSLDGRRGPQTRAAIRAFQEREGLAVSGELDSNTLARLALPVPVLTSYRLTPGDLARLRPLGRSWLEKSEQTRLDYETALELVAERFASDPAVIRRLNPGVDWKRVGAGTSVVVPNYEPPPANGRADFLKIYLGRRLLQAFDRDNRLLAQFPCSIARKVEKRPTGETLRVAVVAPDPNYTFNPEVFPESPEAQSIGRKLVIHPGPNNPVGTVWIGLDKPGYGIHGTPAPEQVGRTESHGCFRLANWNVEYLLKLVAAGTPIVVEP